MNSYIPSCTLKISLQKRPCNLQTLTILLLTIFGLLRIMEVLNLRWKDVAEEIIWSEDSQYKGSRREIITLMLWDMKTSGSKEGLPEYVVVCDRRRKQPLHSKEAEEEKKNDFHIRRSMRQKEKTTG